MEMKITSEETTKSEYYEFDQYHYMNLTLENVDGIDPRAIVSVIMNSNAVNRNGKKLRMSEIVEILKITNPDGEIIEDIKDLEEINSNKDLRLFLYEELTNEHWKTSMAWWLER